MKNNKNQKNNKKEPERNGNPSAKNSTARHHKDRNRNGLQKHSVSEKNVNNLSGQIAQELDFYRLRETISGYASSEEGKELLLQRESIYDREKITYLKNLGREWYVFLQSRYASRIPSWPAIGKNLPLLGVEGATLSQDQAYALLLFCISVIRIKEKILSSSPELSLPLLTELVNRIPDMNSAGNILNSVLDDSGQLKDLPELRAIRSKIEKINREIEAAIRKYTSDTTLNTVLQSNVPVYRADRQLLAVRADKRGAVSGIVHEVSPSGQTVYIEPEESVKANNELIQAQFELDSKIRTIFTEMTAKLSVYRQDFIDALECLLLMDTTCAAALWQKEINGVFAEDCDRNIEPPSLIGARHPLLGSKAVPVNLIFHDGKNILIITGPNTGGKTVTLKTFALFVLLNQAGFPIPACEGTRLPLFNGIFADIGDEQSIDESLSTFSSHMKKIGYMLRHADKDSLVLLDELGSGTDPQEGGAISMAVLDELLEKESFVLVTTHHGILKNYGYTHPTCINASVEFNTQTLSPTYALHMGIPGESHALEIASNSGLSGRTVKQARHYIATEQADVSKLIKGLSKKHQELDRKYSELEKKLFAAEEENHRLQVEEANLQQRELKISEMEHRQSTAFLDETRRKLENLVRELREGEINREKTLGVKQFISDLTQEVVNREQKLLNDEEAFEIQLNELSKSEYAKISQNGIRFTKASERNGSSKKTKQRVSNREALENATVYTPENTIPVKQKKAEVRPVLKLVPGAEVLAGRERRKGTLLQEVKKGIWSVQFGSLKMNVPETQLMVIQSEQTAAGPSYVLENDDGITQKAEYPAFELRLLGMRCEEAVKALEHQMDLCLIHNFKNFSVIHGTGSGVLQQAVRDYLSHHPAVQNFYFAPAEDGGFGKTYVALF